MAAELLKIKAVKLQPEQPFTWASGWKSPFYCDNRKTLSFPELRTRVKLGLANLILEEFPEADTVAGVATGAIAQGALVAEAVHQLKGILRISARGEAEILTFIAEIRQHIVMYTKKLGCHLCPCKGSTVGGVGGRVITHDVPLVYHPLHLCGSSS